MVGWDVAGFLERQLNLDQVEYKAYEALDNMAVLIIQGCL